MPDIQKLYESAETEGEDALVVLGVAAPNLGTRSPKKKLKRFLRKTDTRILCLWIPQAKCLCLMV